VVVSAQKADATGPAKLRVVHAADFPDWDTKERLAAFVEEMRNLKPDLLLLGGDLAYDDSDRWYALLQTAIADLERAGTRVLVVSGNHEWKGRARWLRNFGPVGNFRVNHGDLAIICLETAHSRDRFTPSQFRWFQAQLEDLGGRVPIVLMHHPIFPPGTALHGDGDGTGGYLRGFQRAFIRLCVEKNVAVVLSGHWHQDAVFDAQGNLRDDTADFPGPKFVVTTSLGDSTRRVTRWPGVHFGYRILDFDRGRLVRYTYGENAAGQPSPIASVPVGTYLRKP
jgi:3',5'-cyclic AMP phosphodiesterase CpdA